MYLDDINTLVKRLPAGNDEYIEYDGMYISRLQFQSEKTGLLPKVSTEPLGIHRDPEIKENKHFPYYTFRSARNSQPGGTIILLHGLNEKSWDKYLPWAAQLCRDTGKTVILFPIAFHMDRAPASWSSPRRMQALAKERQARFRAGSSSFVNAALSTRLHAAPERFFFSGLEAYADVLELVRRIERGTIPGAGGRIDFFGYSIGAFLTQIILLSNPTGPLSGSKAVLFCGGTTLDMMNPVSKYIMDSAAAGAVLNFFGRDFTRYMTGNSRMTSILSAFPEESRVFRSMTANEPYRQERERLFQRITGRLSAILIGNDRVIPADAVRRTFSGRGQSTGKPVRVLEFPFPCDHVHPFPQISQLAGKVDSAFRKVFTLASEQLA